MVVVIPYSKVRRGTHLGIARNDNKMASALSWGENGILVLARVISPSVSRIKRASSRRASRTLFIALVKPMSNQAPSVFFFKKRPGGSMLRIRWTISVAMYARSSLVAPLRK
jgi:hypothetical protein